MRRTDFAYRSSIESSLFYPLSSTYKNTVKVPNVTTLRCHDFLVHAYLHKALTNIPGIHDNGPRDHGVRFLAVRVAFNFSSLACVWTEIDNSDTGVHKFRHEIVIQILTYLSNRPLAARQILHANYTCHANYTIIFHKGTHVPCLYVN